MPRRNHHTESASHSRRKREAWSVTLAVEQLGDKAQGGLALFSCARDFATVTQCGRVCMAPHESHRRFPLRHATRSTSVWRVASFAVSVGIQCRGRSASYAGSGILGLFGSTKACLTSSVSRTPMSAR